MPDLKVVKKCGFLLEKKIFMIIRIYLYSTKKKVCLHFYIRRKTYPMVNGLGNSDAELTTAVPQWYL